MRCRNCSTVLMATDPQCPTCGAPAPREGYDATRDKPDRSVLRTIFLIGGGLIGLAIYHAVTGMLEAISRHGKKTAAAGPVMPSRANPVKLLLGLFCLLLGSGLVALALLHFWNTWDIQHRKPHAVSAAELVDAKKDTTLTRRWISYDFEQSRPTGKVVVRHRLGHAGEVHAPWLLVQVEDKWLLASVAPGFEGKHLVGRLHSMTPDNLKTVTRQFQHGEEAPLALLPYEFNAIDACESEYKLRYTQVGIIAVVGLLGLLLGLGLARGGQKPIPRQVAARYDPFAMGSLP